MHFNAMRPSPQASTNTRLPAACAEATIGDEFDPTKTRDCITQWVDAVTPTAAYSVGDAEQLAAAPPHPGPPRSQGT